jgi:hypothetical protein
MNMTKLGNPSRELAIRVLTAVDFEHRLDGYCLRERAGVVPVTMFSFEEVVSLLNDPYPRVAFDELEKWVREAMDDKELAECIAEAIRIGRSDGDRSLHIEKLMAERLNQCKKLV